MTLNGIHSQEVSKNSRIITSVQRDSIYKKIQRGKAAEANVKYLDSALVKCDSVKSLVYRALDIEEMKTDSLSLIINKGKLVVKNLELNIKDEIKRGRRRSFWSFLKGTVAGAIIIVILDFVL